MFIYDFVQKAVKDAIKSLYESDVADAQIQIQKTKKEFEGEITLVAFPLLRISKTGPEQTADQIGQYLLDNGIIRSFNVVKGFLNLELLDKTFSDQLSLITKSDNYGWNSEGTNKTYMVEYASPNTNKPLHLGHLRNIFLGYSVANILKANGHKVVKTQIINDRGIHICKSMIAWLKFGEGETPDSSNMKGDHLIGKYYVKFDKEYKKEIAELVEGGMEQKEAELQAPILLEARELLKKWESKDPEVYSLWEKMNSWVYEGFNATYKKMGVDFDSIYYESDTYILGKEIVLDGLNKGVFYQKEDGSVWCGLSEYKMDDKLLLRGDGTSVYMTQDIGTAIERFKDEPSLSGLIYTVGNEQNHHFKVLFAILSKLGYEWAKECYHLSYGMVELPHGKMKSREGTVVDADDIMASVTNDALEMTQERGHIQEMNEEDQNHLFHTIGMGGLKYYLLKVDPKAKMLFNPEESIDLNGNTGPFIQYTYARIQSIMNNVDKVSAWNDQNVDLNSNEKEVILNLAEYPEMIDKAGKEYSPALIANYTYDLVKSFNSFYQSTSILKEENTDKKELRVNLSNEVAKIVKKSMGLLGVNVPNKM